jgi:E3 ubiquitin-protein ligase UBR1
VSFLLPFLRSALVLFRACHAVSAPIRTHGSRRGSKATTAAESPLVTEFHSLLRTLHLPGLEAVLSSPQHNDGSSMDTTSSSGVTIGSSSSSVPLLFQPLVSAFGALYPPGVRLTLPLLSAFVPPSFIRLPAQYDALFQALSDPNTVCSTCGTTPTKPALCLQCGRLLCAQGECCRESQRGELSRHTARCCPCDGLYLLLREAGVLSVSQGLAYAAGSCYTDRENETDVGLRRGRPLHLHAERLEHLRNMAAQVGAVTSYISRGRGHRYMHELSQRNQL